MDKLLGESREDQGFTKSDCLGQISNFTNRKLTIFYYWFRIDLKTDKELFESKNIFEKTFLTQNHQVMSQKMILRTNQLS